MGFFEIEEIVKIIILKLVKYLRCKKPWLFHTVDGEIVGKQNLAFYIKTQISWLPVAKDIRQQSTGSLGQSPGD